MDYEEIADKLIELGVAYALGRMTTVEKLSKRRAILTSFTAQPEAKDARELSYTSYKDMDDVTFLQVMARMSKCSYEACQKFEDIGIRLASAREQGELELGRAFSMLEINGVPRERAKTVSNGIDVLVTRLSRAIESAEGNAAIYREQAERKGEEMRAAGRAFLASYKEGHDSGDWGNWDLEQDAEYVAFRAALATPAEVTKWSCDQCPANNTERCKKDKCDFAPKPAEGTTREGGALYI